MFCSGCGKELPAEASYCAACGRAAGALAAGATPGRVARHVQAVAILWMVVSAFWLCIGLAVFFFASIVLPVFLTGFPFRHLLPGIGTFVGGTFLVLSLGGLAAGWGLMQREAWARMVIIVLSVLALLRFPLGTALGIYSLWVLLPADSAAEYARLRS